MWKTTGSKDLIKCSTSSSVNLLSSGVLLSHLSLYRSKCSLKKYKRYVYDLGGPSIVMAGSYRDKRPKIVGLFRDCERNVTH